jgi:uncharacterized damage-inducible protein DinB
MYYHINDFLLDWEFESAATLKLFRNLTDESLSKKLHPNVRSLGFLSWHIVHTMQEMMKRTGIKVDIKDQQNYNNETAKEIADTYEKGAELLAEEIKKNWTDADLAVQDEMYGEMWKRGMTLSVLVRHQSHHRAEMIVLMRMLDLPVIGIYGPIKEEWKQWGMPAME